MHPFESKYDVLSQLLTHCKKLFKFYIMESAKKYIKISLMVFPKKVYFGAIGLFLAPKLCTLYNSVLAGTIFGKICSVKVGKR